jgi:hypothetical protein
MSLWSALLAAPPALPSADWVGVATRPGSGLGFLPAALTVQPLATLGVLLLTGLAAALRLGAGGEGSSRSRPG